MLWWEIIIIFHYILLSTHNICFGWEIIIIFNDILLFVCLFVCFVALRPKSTVMVMAGWSVHLTTLFSWASLNKQLTSASCTYFRLLLTTTLLEWFSGREENDRRNYFMIYLHQSMGPGQDRTRDPWICDQTRICSQTCYRLLNAALHTFIWRPR